MPRPPVLSALPILVALFVATAPYLSAQTNQSKFIPPDISTASDINYPINSIASGVVVVAVKLDGEGAIKGTEVLRDVPSLTAPVLQAIKTWTFRPATLDDKPADSIILVSVVFNPFDYQIGGATVPALGKALKALAPDANGFMPPMTVAAAWTEYPPNTTAQGAVILDARISGAGHVTRATEVYRIPPLTDPSIDAAKNWTFKPATFQGPHVAANAVIGYVFRLPNVSSPAAQP